MAAMDILNIIRQTLDDDKMTDTEASDTYIPIAETIFENITKETVTITNNSSGNVAWDMGLAYLALMSWYATEKEGYIVTEQEEGIPAHVWWEQTAFRHLVAIGYAEYFEYIKGMYILKDDTGTIKVADMMAVKDLTEGYGDVI